MTTIALPSVQSLLLHMQFQGQPLATGTGFAVVKGDRSFLITNRHNVTGRNQYTNQPISKTGGLPDELVIVHNRKGRLGEWVPRLEKLYNGNHPLWIEHPTLKDKADFVALPMTQTNDIELYPYTLARPGPGADILVGPADTVSVIGFPFGRTAGGACGIWATGFMASEPALDFEGLPIFLVDCRSREGQSGSPVIAYRSGGSVAMAMGGSAILDRPLWKFLGIYSGRINAESDIGMVWKASAVEQLVSIL